MDLLESNVDFPILVIGNEKGQCMHYMVAQSDNKFKIQPGKIHFPLLLLLLLLSLSI